MSNPPLDSPLLQDPIEEAGFENDLYPEIIGRTTESSSAADAFLALYYRLNVCSSQLAEADTDKRIAVLADAAELLTLRRSLEEYHESIGILCEPEMSGVVAKTIRLSHSSARPGEDYRFFTAETKLPLPNWATGEKTIR